MQNCLRWSGLVRRRRSPVCSSPTRRHLPPSCCAVAVCLVSGFASGFIQRLRRICRVSPPSPFGPPVTSLRFGVPALLPVHFPTPPRGALGPFPRGAGIPASLVCSQCSQCSTSSHPQPQAASHLSFFGRFSQVLSGFVRSPWR